MRRRVETSTRASPCSVAGGAAGAISRRAMTRAGRAGVPERVSSVPSTTPREVVPSSRRPAFVARISNFWTPCPASTRTSTRSPFMTGIVALRSTCRAEPRACDPVATPPLTRRAADVVPFRLHGLRIHAQARPHDRAHGGPDPPGGGGRLHLRLALRLARPVARAVRAPHAHGPGHPAH